MRLIIVLVILILIAGGLTVGGSKAYEIWQEKQRPEFREANVDRGDIVEVVNATGEVKPILTLQVGTFVSGPIVKLEADFNDRVEAGDLLVQIDKRTFLANVKRDEATLTSRRAEVKRVEALLVQARRDEKRAELIRDDNEAFISGAEIDQVVATRASLEASLELAAAAIDQASATLDLSRANLDFCDIRATQSGIIIDRIIEPGETLAASFQTPELFHIAVDLDKEIHVYAAVDEAEIGIIKKAQLESRPVQFTVDAHRDDLFDGTIYQIRMRPTVTQNVVTYPVIVVADNPEIKLLPGMTASLSFQTNKKTDIVRLPNAALRFFPANPKWVREEDRKLLDGSAWEEVDDEEDDIQNSAFQSHAAESKRRKRHVWVREGDELRAVEVELGISDSKFTELTSGSLKPDQKLVTGVKSKK